MKHDIATLTEHPLAYAVPLPQRGDWQALAADLAEHGQQDPIDITPEGVILDGRTRVRILLKQGAKEVEVREIDLPKADQVPYLIRRAVNRRHLNAEQKRELIRLLKNTTIKVGPKGEKVGMTAKAIAETVGVAEITVKRTKASVSTDTDAPTHVEESGGRLRALPQPAPAPVTTAPVALPFSVPAINIPKEKPPKVTEYDDLRAALKRVMEFSKTYATDIVAVVSDDQLERLQKEAKQVAKFMATIQTPRITISI